MPETPYLIAAVLISGGITWALRALPFAFLRPLRRSRVFQELGDALPVGIMLVLVIHTLDDTRVLDLAQSIPVAVGVVVTAGLHWWRENPLLSIGAGTGSHVLLLHLL